MIRVATAHVVALWFAVAMVVHGQHDHGGGRRPPDVGARRRPDLDRRPDGDHRR